MKALKAAALAVGLAGLGACVTVAPPIGSNFHAANASSSILLMEPDVQVTFLTTGGAERRADWSEAAKDNLRAALISELEQSGERVTEYDANEAEIDHLIQSARVAS